MGHSCQSPSRSDLMHENKHSRLFVWQLTSEETLMRAPELRTVSPATASQRLVAELFSAERWLHTKALW